MWSVDEIRLRIILEKEDIICTYIDAGIRIFRACKEGRIYGRVIEGWKDGRSMDEGWKEVGQADGRVDGWKVGG